MDRIQERDLDQSGGVGGSYENSYSEILFGPTLQTVKEEDVRNRGRTNIPPPPETVSPNLKEGVIIGVDSVKYCRDAK